MNLTEEQELIRNTARDFATNELAPTAAERDQQASFPADALKQMGELGMMGMLLPEQYGGVDADHVAFALALEEIAAGDGACSTIMSVHNSVACMPIYKFGTDEQKQRWLPDMSSGKLLGAFALTEPGAGSDASAITTKATKTANGYQINGVKQFITSGKNADVAIVFARTDEGKRGISAFIVDTTNPGYVVSSVEAKHGQRSSDTCQITLDKLELSQDNLLGAEGDGYRIALSNLEGGRIGIAAQAVGMAKAAYNHALEYAKTRSAFNAPIIEHQAIAFKLADMATKIQAARLMILNAAQLRDQNKPCLQDASMAKLFASEMAEAVCSDAIQIHGGYGYLQDYPVERIARDVRVCSLYEGTSEIQRLVISRNLEPQ
jgi:alkylation response protein AidB-like acyl-CoA dehydrogenase